MESYVPPHDLEAEESLIGGILNYGHSAIERIALDLRPEEFYREEHGVIYKACVELYTKNEPIDLVTLGAYLERSGLLQRVGGRARLATYQSKGFGSGSFIREYAAIIRDKARLRATFRILNSGIESVVRRDQDAASVIDNTIKQLFDLAINADNSNVERIGERTVGSFIESLTLPETARLRYPWPALDGLLSGLWPSEMTVVCGRPGMAKSAFAMNLALDLSMNHGVGVGIFSLEMSKTNLVNRMLAMLANVDSKRLREKELSDEEMQRIYEAAIPLSEAPLFIDDDPGLSETDLVIKSRKLKWQHNIGCIMIDYLQLLKPSGKYINREQEVSSFSSTARYVARELQIPVMVLAQLNRAPEIRQEHRPLLSDLRESGALEQDSDVVLGLYRDYYYNLEADPQEAEVIVLKHRNGATDTIKLGFEKRITKFYAL